MIMIISLYFNISKPFSNVLLYIYVTFQVVHTDSRRGRLVHSTETLTKVKLTWYRNGLMIDRGPLREKGSASYKTYIGMRRSMVYGVWCMVYDD
ncbi:hypothetical protein EON65_45485 [archaeon]|nr:MAG: hypothetical protein EON65_45485 [archaeon]